MSFDLLSTVEQGGCSAKLSAVQLAEALKNLPKVANENLLVGIETHDDAGVYKLTEDIAIIQTTDFFPPICSDPYEFGQIAAANALSDVYAMGGKAVTALNLCMFPSNKIPLQVLADILRGGLQKISEAGAVVAGGHTIDDYPPKYGLAVTGTIHPDRIITNSKAHIGDVLLLTKAIGTGVIVAGKRVGLVNSSDYQSALESMKLLNKKGAELMQQFDVACATDITGFGLIGHALKMAQGSNVSLEIDTKNIPFLEGAYSLAASGCLPGGMFRNLEFAEPHCLFAKDIDYSTKMLCFDPQTSGGLLICIRKEQSKALQNALITQGYPQTRIMGTVICKSMNDIVIQ